MSRVPRPLLAALLVAGCTAGVPTAPPRSDAAPGPSATTPAAPTTQPDFSSSELCPGGTGNTCELGAGEHHSLGFGDGVAFTLAEDWVVRANETDVIGLESGALTSPRVFELITGALRIPCFDGSDCPAVTQPDVALARFRAYPADYGTLDVAELPPTTVADAPASVFELSTADNPVLFHDPVTQRQSTLHSGRRARLLWSTWAGAPLVVLIESDEADFAALLDSAQPILESLEFGDED